MDARSSEVPGREHDNQMTALQTALDTARGFYPNPEALLVLNAAEVLIRMGADWNQPLYSTRRSDGLLVASLFETVHFASDTLNNYESDTRLYREHRKGWGRVVKAMVETASNNATLLVEVSNAFNYVVNHPCHRGLEEGVSEFGPWAIEAVGKLLLSTGFTPIEADMKTWKALCLNRSELGLEQDGDKGQWAFVLDGIDTDSKFDID